MPMRSWTVSICSVQKAIPIADRLSATPGPLSRLEVQGFGSMSTYPMNWPRLVFGLLRRGAVVPAGLCCRHRPDFAGKFVGFLHEGQDATSHGSIPLHLNWCHSLQIFRASESLAT